MPPITSSRAGTRATHTSPLLKKPAKPVGSLFGLRSRFSNSETSNGSAVFINSMVMVVPDDPGAVLEKIPDKRHVHRQHDGDAGFGMYKKVRMIFRIRHVPADQLKNFNRNEKSRFADDEPDDPAHAENQPARLQQHEQAVNDRADRQPLQIGRRDFADAVGQFEEEFFFRVKMKKFEQLAEILRQVVVREAVGTQRQQQRGHAFEELDAYDEIQRRRPLRLGFRNQQGQIFLLFTHQRILDSKNSKSSDIFKRSCLPSSR